MEYMIFYNKHNLSDPSIRRINSVSSGNGKNWLILAIFSLFLMSSFFIAGQAKAVDPKLTINHPNMAAKYVFQSLPDPIIIEAGKEAAIIVKFKNIGTETWPTIGRKFISAYTMEPRERSSLFTSKNWTSAKQTGPINKPTKPGEMADLAILLKAPQKIGDYTEEFHLAAENYSWVKGGYFFLKIKVVAPKTPAAEPAKEAVNLSAAKFLQSLKEISVGGGEQVKLVIGFQNRGDKPWAKYAIVANQPISLANASARLSFADELWKSSSIVLEKEMSVPPEGYVRETFYFRAPSEEGEYSAKFYLQVDGETLSDVYAEALVTVTSNAPNYYQVPHNSENSLPAASFYLDSEPRIRVGLWQPPSYAQFRSEEADYDVYDGVVKMGVLARDKLGALMRKNGQFYFRGGNLEFYSDNYIRLSPVDNPRAVFNILNYNRYVTWKGPENFNYYRGAMEYRLGEVKTDALWVINDLLFEDYMAGIAENGNNSPPEYLRAQAVAQRSYAYATIKSKKYGVFDVVATTGDQLYLGQKSEEIMPNFVAGVKDTRGAMVTYNGEVVTTPYYAHAVCRTYSWAEKWGGAIKPWLVSVKTNYDCQNYSAMLGHGVGMSQMDASRRAKAEGLGWQDLVKYYYTGVEIERIYE